MTGTEPRLTASTPVEPTIASPAWTPGPWVWDRNSPTEARGLFGANGNSVLYASCDVSNYGLSVDPCIEVSVADARLIASAPELYAALHAVLHTYDEGGVPLAEAFRMANAAIRHASTGELK